MTVTASCHCGAIKIEAPTPTEASTCNCTWCHRTGAVWAYYAPEDLKITRAEGAERDYAPNGMNHHHFCGVCGGNTHGFSPDWSSMYNNDGTLKPGMTEGIPEGQKAAINLRMVVDLDLDSLPTTKLDGRNSW